jgi:adenylyl- and sulfurtransferase ThiI
MRKSGTVTNVQVRKHAFSTFVINPLFHIYQKEKIENSATKFQKFESGIFAIF